MNICEFFAYILTCGCCRRPEYQKKPTKVSKNYETLESITPHKKSPFADSTDPMLVKTSQMTQTFFIGEEHKFKTEIDVIHANGYRIEGHIDQGAFASVDKAVHIEKNFVVAIKRVTIPARRRDRDNVMSDVKNELFILETVRHQHIIRLITHFIVKSTTNEQIFIVMQYAEGGTMSSFLDRNGPFNEQSCCVWFAQILDALSYMHEEKKLAHRDLKLANILLDENKDVLVADFGLSRVARGEEDDPLMSKTFCGTIPYMAPELLTKEKKAYGSFKYNAQAVDVWALGVILYKLFNRQYPFNINNRRRCLRKMKKKDWKFVRHTLNEPSAHFTNILQGIFEPYPENRATMKELKEHDWVRHMFIEDSLTLRQRDEEYRKTLRSPT